MKHSEGPAAQKLRKVRPELFTNPVLPTFDPDAGPRPWLLEMPMAGDGLYVTEQILLEYCSNAQNFISEVLKHFEKHSEDYYPR